MKIHEFIAVLNHSKEERHGIYTHPLLVMAIFAAMLAAEFLLVSLSYHLVCFITFPFLCALAICYRWFIGIWRSYSYSMVYIVLMPTAVLVLAVLFGSRLRDVVFGAVHSLLAFI